jgi:YggT family protein
MGIARAVASIFDLITLLLIISVFLTWIPNINWYNEPFKTLKAFSDLFFAPFRKIIPPIGMIDISPIVAFVLLGVIRNIVVSLLVSIGL